MLAEHLRMLANVDEEFSALLSDAQSRRSCLSILHVGRSAIEGAATAAVTCSTTAPAASG